MGKPGHKGVTLPQSALRLRFKLLVMAHEAPGDLVLARPPTLSHPRALRPSGVAHTLPALEGGLLRVLRTEQPVASFLFPGHDEIFSDSSSFSLLSSWPGIFLLEHVCTVVYLLAFGPLLKHLLPGKTFSHDPVLSHPLHPRYSPSSSLFLSFTAFDLCWGYSP